ncbi:MAG TPA: hypothetical protein VG075_04430 [Candidatus Acidoferrum sp.]|jgi:hypothetical protein|nr:hypothetical protein [Candidatus Acidoferrum sp.]
MGFRPRVENESQTITDLVREMLWSTPYQGDGNVQLVAGCAAAENFNVTGRYAKAVLRDLVNRMADKGVADENGIVIKIGYSTGFRNALAEAKRMVPHYRADGEAFEKLIIERLYEARSTTGRDFSFNVADDIAAVIQQLGKEHEEGKGGLPLSDLGQRQEAQARGLIQRRDQHAALIKRITGGRDAYPKWSPEHGRAINISADVLATKTLDELIQIEREVEQYRQLRNETREEQRARLQEVSRANGRVDANNSNSAVAVGTSTGFANAAVDRTVGGVNPHADSLFTNPVTNREYTRSELVALSSSNMKLFKKMINTDLARTNAILASK